MEPKEKPQKKLTGVRLDPELVKELKYLALDTDRTVTSLLEEGAQMVLKKYQAQAKKK